MEQLRYYLNFFINIPLFPILYLQGKKIRKTILRLPEAQIPSGVFDNGKRQIRLLSIGESTIAGVGVKTHEQGLTGHLAKRLSNDLEAKLHWEVIARSGYTAQKVNKKLLSKIPAQKLDILIIGLGGNDTFKMSSPKHWEENINLLINKLNKRFPQTPIVFVNVPPIRDFPAFTPLIKLILGRQIDLLHQVLERVVKKHQAVWYIDERIELKNWLTYFKDRTYQSNDFFSDGVHPSALTYKTWGEEVAKFIIKEKIIS